MISDPRVFSETHLPQELPHRGSELEHLARTLKPAIYGEAADDVLLAGPSGVGKTVVARHVLRRLEAVSPDIATVYVQCLGLSAADILRAISRAVGIDPGDRWVVTDLREALIEGDRPTIVVLDEADDCPESGVINHLAGIPALSVVAIVHDAADWVSRVDAIHRHRFEGDGVLMLRRYGTIELAEILEQRAKKGLSRGSVEWSTLKEIADAVAGVARDGIQTLYSAAKTGEERGHDVVRSSDVIAGLERAQNRIRKEHLSSLTFHHHVLYAIIAEEGEIKVGDLHTRYEDLADKMYRGRSTEPIGRRGRRYKLAKLSDYDLIEYTGENRHRQYQPVDSALAPPIDLGMVLR